MIKTINILFVSEDKRLFNNEFEKYFSGIVSSIIEANILNSKVKNQNNRKSLPNKIFFIHNARFNENKTTFSKEISKKFLLPRKTKNLSKKINQKLFRKRITFDSECNLDSYSKDEWAIKLKRFIDLQLNYFMVHNIGRNHISLMDRVFDSERTVEEGFINFYREKTQKDRKLSEEYNDPEIITINTYHDCDTILNHKNRILQSQEIFIIIRPGKDDCYSNSLDESHLSANNSSLLTLITSEKTSNKPELSDKENGYFNPYEKRYILQKEKMDNSILQNRLNKWSHSYIYPPNCFFSYASKGDHNYFMEKINASTKLLYPSLFFKRDSDNDFINIEKFSKNLYQGDVVIHLIDKEFLESFYCMRELVKVFKNRDAQFEKNTKFNDYDFDNIAELGIIPLISKKIESLILTENMHLKIFWEEELKNKSDKDKDIIDITEIIENIESIKNKLATVASFNKLEDFEKDKFPNLLYAIGKSLPLKRNPYHNYSLEAFKTLMEDLESQLTITSG